VAQKQLNKITDALEMKMESDGSKIMTG